MPWAGFEPGSKRDTPYLNLEVCCLRPLGHHGRSTGLVYKALILISVKTRSHLEDLDKKKPVIVCGDLNVAHKEIDLANPKTNKKSAGFTKEERESKYNRDLNTWLIQCLIDYDSGIRIANIRLTEPFG